MRQITWLLRMLRLVLEILQDLHRLFYLFNKNMEFCLLSTQLVSTKQLTCFSIPDSLINGPMQISQSFITFPLALFAEI